MNLRSFAAAVLILTVVGCDTGAENNELSVPGTYNLVVNAASVTYPESLTIEAIVLRASPISGASVTARITRPDAVVVDLPLFDDGQGVDRIEGDGAYSVEIPYDQDGDYAITAIASNNAGTAKTTVNGQAISVQADGTSAPTFEPELITENFRIVTETTASVSGYRSDDHAGNGTEPSLCTGIFDNNIDTLGRIDNADDVDCFFFVPSTPGVQVVVRATSLGDNVDVLLRVLNYTGTTEITRADLTTSTSPDSGVITVLMPEVVDASGFVVTIESVEDSTAGAYAISAGSELSSDRL